MSQGDTTLISAFLLGLPIAAVIQILLFSRIVRGLALIMLLVAETMVYTLFGFTVQRISGVPTAKFTPEVLFQWTFWFPIVVIILMTLPYVFRRAKPASTEAPAP